MVTPVRFDLSPRCENDRQQRNEMIEESEEVVEVEEPDEEDLLILEITTRKCNEWLDKYVMPNFSRATSNSRISFEQNDI